MEAKNGSIFAGISPYDEAFPMKLLEEAFTLQMEKAEKTASKIYDDVLRKIPEYWSTDLSGNGKIRIVVDALWIVDEEKSYFSIKALTDSIFQMTLMMQSEIIYLRNKAYEYGKKRRTELIKE